MEAALTILSVLIAVAIFAIVLAAINTVFYSALRLRNRSAAAFDEALPVQQAVAIIKRDLAAKIRPLGLMIGAGCIVITLISVLITHGRLWVI